MAPMDVLINIVVPLAMFILMMVIGLDLTTRDFRRIAQYPKAITVGASCQLLGLPLLAAAIINFVPMNTLDIGTLIIISACPGGGLSNVMTAQARGNVALSISYTATASIVGLITIPIIASTGFQLFLDDTAPISVPMIPMVAQLAVLIVIPIALGMWIRSKYYDLVQRQQKNCNRFSTVLIVVIIVMSVSVDNGMTGEAFIQALPAAFAFSIGSVLIGLLVITLSGMEYKDRIALLIEFTVRHTGIATLIVLVILERFDMMALIAACSLIQVVLVLAVVFIIRFMARSEPGSDNETADEI